MINYNSIIKGILFICMGVFMNSCKKQNTFYIKGESRNIGNGKIVYLMKYNYRSFNICDSAIVNNNEFFFRHTFDEEGVYGITLNRNSRKPATFWSENDTLYVTLWKNNKAVFNGGEKNVMYHNTLCDIEKGTLNADSLIDKYPDSGITAYFLSRFLCMRMNYDSLLTYRKKMEGNTSIYMKQIDHVIESLKGIRSGAFAPGISLPGINGDMNSLSQCRNRYTILLFHASWCPDCKSIWPDIYSIYNEFNKDTELFTVALDTDIKSWKEYINNSKGIHVCDTLQWQSPVVRSYAIRGIPSLFLITPEGKIDMAFCTPESISLRLKEIISEGQLSDRTNP